MQHLSFLTRDWTSIPCSGNRSLNHWTFSKVPWLTYWFLERNTFFYSFVDCGMKEIKTRFCRSSLWTLLGSLVSESALILFVIIYQLAEPKWGLQVAPRINGHSQSVSSPKSWPIFNSVYLDEVAAVGGYCLYALDQRWETWKEGLPWICTVLWKWSVMVPWQFHGFSDPNSNPDLGSTDPIWRSPAHFSNLTPTPPSSVLRSSALASFGLQRYTLGTLSFLSLLHCMLFPWIFGCLVPSGVDIQVSPKRQRPGLFTESLQYLK